MMKAYWKDIWRTVSREKKRFLSIVVIAALGVTMMCGLRASCVDLRYSADKFFDEQNLFDIRILSTLGLTDDDIEELKKLDQIEVAEGGYSETVYTLVDEVKKSIDLRTLSKEELNMPYLQEGRMPETETEIVITRKYWIETGKTIGDVITLQEEPESFDSQTYTITGIVIDTLDINSTEGSMGFRSTAATDYVGYVIPEAADSDIYTVVYLALDGTSEINCYTAEYSDSVEQVVNEIEDIIKAQRELARYDAIYNEAMDEWLDGKQEMEEEFTKADKEIAEAKQEIADGKKELADNKQKIADNWAELADGENELKVQEAKAESEFAKAWKKIKDSYKEIVSGEKELEQAYKELISGQKQLDEVRVELKAQEETAAKEFAEAYKTLEASEAELEAGYAEVKAGYEQWEIGCEQWETGYEQWEAGYEEIEAGYEQWEAGYVKWEAGKAEYEAGKQEYEAMKPQMESQITALELALQNPELTDAEKTAYQENLTQLKRALESGEQQLAEAKTELEAGKLQLDASKLELDTAKEELETGKQKLDASKLELDTAKEQLDISKEQLELGKAELEAGKKALKDQEEAAKIKIAAGWKSIDENQEQLDEGMKQYESGVSELNSGKAELIAGEKELKTQEARADKQFKEAWKEIFDGKQKLKDGEAELADGEKELADGEKELAESILEYEEEKTKAEKELEDAKKEIDDIDMTRWYVQDRTILSGYTNVKSDADSIQAIGDIFPVLFLVVAILISLTTITRMVEEERGLIGTYKALGFTNAEIRRKYLIYAFLACLLGGLLGYFAGYVVLPTIIFIVFRVMYLLPEYNYQFEILYGLVGILFFEIGVVGATLYSCRKALLQTPATLMRPKAPKAGSRVFLERIAFIWKRLSFLNKVTARNLFRYKKRMMMTIFGIAGCTALLLCGFTIKDTVAEMMPQQYEVVYKYDLMAVTVADDMKELEEILNTDEEVGEYLQIGMETADIYNEAGKKESVQIIVVPNGKTLEDYIFLKTQAGQEVELGEEDILLTRNATRTLELKIGDKIKIQNLDLKEAEIEITQIVENYFGNTVYMTENVYEKLFGEFEANAVLAQFTEKCEDEKAYTDHLKREKIVLSANCTQAMKDEFSSAFRLLNMVVVVILVLAALLAFVVLFTLSNTNISERERELATIKVLGFYHSEVHSYVNKETWILTLLGILFGMPLGWLLGRYVMGILKFSSLEFYIDLYPQSYLYAAAITVVFGIMVNFITNKVLDKINMVEALKSVE